jgi:hypothetical protein
MSYLGFQVAGTEAVRTQEQLVQHLTGRLDEARLDEGKPAALRRRHVGASEAELGALLPHAESTRATWTTLKAELEGMLEDSPRSSSPARAFLEGSRVCCYTHCKVYVHGVL